MKSLRQKISLLEKVVNCEVEHSNPEELYREIYSHLERRWDRISDSLLELNSYWHAIPYPESEQLTEEEIKLMKMFTGRDVDVIFSHLEKEDKLDSNILKLVKLGSKQPIPVYRKDGKITFRNPAPKIGKKKAIDDDRGLVQVWRNPIVNHDYKKHHRGSRQVGSKYFKEIDRETIELAVFNHGLGVIKYRGIISSLYLHLAFNENIGYDDSKPDSPKTNLVRVQVDRMPKSKGYYCSLHGNPISESELRRTCLDKKQIKMILDNPYKLTK